MNIASTKSACFTTCLRYRSKYGKCSSSGYCSGPVESKSHTSCSVKPSAWGLTPRASSYGISIAPAASRHEAASSSSTPSSLPTSGWRSTASAERVADRAGTRVREDRQHKPLGVPERVPVVPRAGQPLCRDQSLLPPRSRLDRVEQGEADGLLELGVAIDLDVGGRPEPIQV